MWFIVTNIIFNIGFEMASVCHAFGEWFGFKQLRIMGTYGIVKT
jgi:hypothetical protein